MDVLQVEIHLFITKCSSKGQVSVPALMVALVAALGVTPLGVSQLFSSFPSV